MTALRFEGVLFDPKREVMELTQDIGASTLYDLAKEAFMTSNLMDVKFPLVPINPWDETLVLIVSHWEVEGGVVRDQVINGVTYRMIFALTNILKGLS